MTDPGGRRVRRSFLGRERHLVRDKLQEALHTEAGGISVATASLTLAAFLDDWLKTVAPTIRPRTFQSYEMILRVHLVPGLGHIPLTRLSPQQVQTFLHARGSSGRSPRSVAIIRAVLRVALGQAERWGLVSRNVAKLVVPPRVARREVKPLNPDQARRFLDIVQGDRFEALYLVALGVGLRQGELLGLAWPDVDLEAGTIRVRHALQRVGGVPCLVEPKSATSHRTVALPSIVLDALRAHRLRQLDARQASGTPSPRNSWDLVFVSTVGTPLDGVAVTRRFQELLLANNLPRQRFHDLRHACASLLLAQGVAPRVVMETLGHSQISLTMNTYSHVAPFLGREAAVRMDAALAPNVGSDTSASGPHS